MSGPFSELSQADKFTVYEAIIVDSGRAKIVEQGFSLARADLVIGSTLLVFTAALMAWDIFSSPWSRVLEVATRDAVDLATGIGGAMLGHLITSTVLGTQLAMFETAAAATMVTVAGFIAGAGIGFLLGLLAGLILDQIFTSGGQPVPSTDKIKLYVADMPDGRALALQMTHDDTKPTSTSSA